MTAKPPRLGPLRQRIELTLAAFVPAFIFLAARTFGTIWFWIFLGLTVVGLVILAVMVVVAARREPAPFVVDQVEDKADDVLGHVGAYLVPVALDPVAGSWQVGISALALLLIVQIHIATGRVHVNPLLYLARRRVYAGVVGDQTRYLICRTDPASWSDDEVRPFTSLANGSLLIEREAS